jgi:hypothetical protein
VTAFGALSVVYTVFTACADAGSANVCGAVKLSEGLDRFNALRVEATDAGDGAGPRAITTRTRLFLSLIVSLSDPEPWIVQPSGYFIE